MSSRRSRSSRSTGWAGDGAGGNDESAAGTRPRDRGSAALGTVPQEPLRGAAAAGLSRWAIVRSVALPAASPGIGVGILLGAGRALGETMAVVMVMGNVVQVPDSLLAPARTLTANIALEMAYATDAHRSALFVSGLALALLTIGLVLAVDRIGARPGAGGASAHVV